MKHVSKENSTINEINSIDCFKILKENKQSHLIDVRTYPEWEFVGVPDLASINKQVIFISWELYPDMKINSNFVTEILQLKLKQDEVIFLICRSGQRSRKAGQYLKKLGYRNCINVFDGFEGDKNLNSQRSTLTGWQLNKLPWKQQ